MYRFASDRCVVHMVGPDTVTFMHTMTTQSFMPANPFMARSFLWLEPKGRIRFEGTCIVHKNQAWISIADHQGQAFIDSVNRAKLLFKLTVERLASWHLTLVCTDSDLANPVELFHPMAPAWDDRNNPVVAPVWSADQAVQCVAGADDMQDAAANTAPHQQDPTTHTVAPVLSEAADDPDLQPAGFVVREPNGTITFWGEPTLTEQLADQASAPPQPVAQGTLSTYQEPTKPAQAGHGTGEPTNPEPTDPVQAGQGTGEPTGPAQAGHEARPLPNEATNEAIPSDAPRFANYEAWRIANGLLKSTTELAQYRPQELGLLPTHVHLAKGCYPGQETVAKQHNIGKPRRSLCVLSTVNPVDETDTITTDATQRGGTITAIAYPYLLGFVPLTDGLLPDQVAIRNQPVQLVKRIGDGLKIPGNIRESRGYKKIQ